MRTKVKRRQITYGIYITLFLMMFGVFFMQGDYVSNKKIRDEIKETSVIKTFVPFTEIRETIVDVKEKLGNLYIKIEKSDKRMHDIQLVDNYMERKLQLVFLSSEVSGLNFNSMQLVNENQAIPWKEAMEKEDFIEDFQLIEGQVQFTLDFTLDTIYVHNVYEDEEAVYIDLRLPKDVYQNVIVIDAGHGGRDSGCYTEGHYVEEKDLNLAMVLSLKERLEKDDVKVYYTRLSDDRVTLKARVDLANELDADLFVSVHCNYWTEGSGPQGIEILYNEYHEDEVLSSKMFAQICLDSMVEATGRKDRGLTKGKNIHIIANSKVPVALLETGFISNWEDLQYLQNEETRDNMVLGIYNGIKKALQILDQEPDYN